jgi:hypothetical protein
MPTTASLGLMSNALVSLSRIVRYVVNGLRLKSGSRLQVRFSGGLNELPKETKFTQTHNEEKK